MTTTPTASYLSLFKVGAGPTTVGGVTSCKLGRKGALKDITALGDEWVRRHRTIKDFQVSVSCTEALDDPGQTAIEAVCPGAVGDGGALAIRVMRGAAHYWAGNAKVSSADSNSQAGDNVDTIDYVFEACDGAGLAYT